MKLRGGYRDASREEAEESVVDESVTEAVRESDEKSIEEVSAEESETMIAEETSAEAATGEEAVEESETDVETAEVSEEESEEIFEEISEKISEEVIDESFEDFEEIVTYEAVYAPVGSGTTTHWDDDTVLTKDTTVEGDLEVGANLELDGHTLTVTGSLFVCGGSLYMQEGTVNVNGDFSLASSYRYNEKTQKTEVASTGRLRMMDDADTIRIGGNYYSLSTAKSAWYDSIRLCAGTIYIGGDFIQSGSVNNFNPQAGHRVVFNGAGTQEIVVTASGTRFGQFETTYGDQRAIECSGTINIESLQSNLNVTPDNFALGNVNLNGNHLTVEGDMQVNGDVTLSGDALNVTGNLTVHGGYLNMQGATVDVGGNFRIESSYRYNEQNELVVASAGRLRMEDAADELRIAGSYYSDSTAGSSFYDAIKVCEGTIYIGGDFVQSGSANNFAARKSLKVVFNGTGTQKIVFTAPGTQFGQFEVTYGDSRAVECSGTINILSLQSNLKLKKISQESFVLGGMDINGKHLTVEGDLVAEGHVRLTGGTLTVNGKLVQQDGGLYVGEGTVTIAGNLTVQNTGYLHMMNGDGTVDIGGSVTFASQKTCNNMPGEHNALASGTMYVGKDITQISTGVENFACRDSHKVVLKGSGSHTISMQTKEAAFAQLELQGGATSVTWEGRMSLWKLLSNMEVTPVTEADGTEHPFYAGAVELNGKNLTIDGDLVAEGHVKLSGGRLTVNGKLVQKDGGLYVGEGYVKITDDLTVRDTGYLHMMNGDGTVDIGGSVTFASQKTCNNMPGEHNALASGTMNVVGNITQISDGVENFVGQGSHMIVLTGSGPHTISMQTQGAAFGQLKLEGSTAPVIWEGRIAIGKLLTDLTVTRTNAVAGTKSTFYAGAVELNGKNLTIDGGLVAEGHVRLTGGTLTVNGNLSQQAGCLYVGNGTLNVTGDLTVEENGWFSMKESGGTADIEGSVCFSTTKRCYSDGGDCSVLNAGTMNVGGNITQISTGGVENFLGQGSHKIVLTGSGPHRISMQTEGATFAQLGVEGGAATTVIWEGRMAVKKLMSELTVTPVTAAATGHPFYAGAVDLNGNNLTIAGALRATGDIKLSGGELTVNGNLSQQEGCLYVGSGKLTVKGDLTVEGTGYFRMQESSGIADIDGSVCFSTTRKCTYLEGSASVLNAGTMNVGGNITQISTGGVENFVGQGEHKIVLKGSGAHTISMQTQGAVFAQLEVRDNAETPVTWEGRMAVKKLMSDLTVTPVTAAATGHPFYAGAVDLNGNNLTIAGALRATGDIKLSGGELTVNGNLSQQEGCLYVGSGKLTVKGDLTVEGTGYFRMQESGGTADIDGSVCFSTTRKCTYLEGSASVLNAGTMNVGGNITQISASVENFVGQGSHKIMLKGSGAHTISMQTQGAVFAQLEVNDSATPVIWEGRMAVVTLASDMKVTPFAGATEHPFYVGNLNLNGHSLEISGDMSQTGTVTINKGNLKITGKYTIADGALLTMTNGEDSVTVEGDMQVGTGTAAASAAVSSLKAGTLTLKGNFVQVGNVNRFAPSGSHKVVLNGTGEQTVSVESATTKFNQLEVAGSRTIKWQGDINIVKAMSDIAIAPVDAGREMLVAGLGLNGQAVTLDGNVRHTSGTVSLNSGSLTVTGAFVQQDGTWNLNSSTMTVGSWVQTGGTWNVNSGTMSAEGAWIQESGTVNLGSGNVNISGNLTQQGGALNTNSGKMIIAGDYTIGSQGSLVMNNAAAMVKVGGNFATASGLAGSNILSAGTLSVDGNFTQTGATDNFPATGKHRVCLTGKNSVSPEVTEVSFEAQGAKFNVLELEKDITAYSFTPSNCYETVVSPLTLNKNTIEFTVPGGTDSLTATQNGADITNTAAWTSSNENVARVTADGVVKAVGNGTATIVVTSSNGAAKTCDVTVRIPFDQCVLTLTETPVPYSPTGCTPTVTVTVKEGDTLLSTLTEGEDYEVVYRNNLTPGEATVTVSGIGKYASGEGRNTLEKTFQIVAKPLTDVTLVLENSSYVYDDSALKPGVTVTDGEFVLTEGRDYTVAYSGNTAVGTATVTVTGMGGYTGSKSETFSITQKNMATADDVAAEITGGTLEYTYTGSAITPAVAVTDGGRALVKDTDYTLNYSDNINAGTATVTVTGMGNYQGVIQKTFTIQPQSIERYILELDFYSTTYTGSAKTPGIALKDGSTPLTGLKDGTDYTLAYSDNVNAGTATVTVTGKGNYSGSRSSTFGINAKSLSASADVTMTFPENVTEYRYTGEAVTPAMTVKDNDKVLVRDTDYTVTYGENTDMGTAWVVVSGIGNYQDALQDSFVIYGTVSYHFTAAAMPSGDPLPTVEPSKFYVESGLMELAPEPACTGYLFAWYSDEECTSVVTNVPKGTAINVDCYGKWQPITYHIHFEPGVEDNAGVTGEMADQKMTYDTQVPLAENAFLRKGYRFMGWKDEKGVTYSDKAAVKNLTAEDGGTVTLTAVWDVYTYNTDTTLENDTVVSGNLLALKNVNLNGHTLTVAGDMTMRGGKLIVGSGNLIVEGNLTIEESGMIQMKQDDGSVTVKGDFCTRSKTTCSSSGTGYNILMAGTLTVGGDFIQSNTKNSFNAYWSQASTHKVVLNGSGVQTVSLEATGAAFNQFEFANADAPGRELHWNGSMNITALLSDMEVFPEDEGADDGILTVKKLAMNGNDVTVQGSVLQKGTINLGGKRLYISGSLAQSSGVLKVNKGTLDVSKDYTITAKSTLHMLNEEDRVNVGGTFDTGSSQGCSRSGDNDNVLMAGILTVGGDLIQRTETKNFNAYWSQASTHKVILNGSGVQTVSLEAAGAAFNQLEFANANDPGRKIKWQGKLYIKKAMSDMTIDPADDNDKTLYVKDLGADGYKIVLDGDVCHESGTVSPGSGEIVVTGAYTQQDGTINLSSGSMTIQGAFTQQKVLNAGTGSLTVGGDYTIGDTGYLTMKDNVAMISVGGNFTTSSTKGTSNVLTAGTLQVDGDFTQSGTSNGFPAKTAHRVYLTGEKGTTVTFESASAKFYVLELGKDISEYTFSPAKCWSKLAVPFQLNESEITLTKPGENFELKATRGGEAVKVTSWTSSDSKVATVDKDGKVTACGNGNAVIVATAEDGAAKRCEVTVSIPFALCTLTLAGEDFEYTESGCEPAVTVEIRRENEVLSVLTEGVDYTIAYSDNTSVGTAKVTATGMGAYSGALDQTFAIYGTVTYHFVAETLPSGEPLPAVTPGKFYETGLEKLEKVSCTGYLLTWYGDKECTAAVTKVPAGTAASVDYYGKWTPVRYSVGFATGVEGNTGISGAMADQKMTYDVEAALTANAYEREGYLFKGWKDAAGTTYADKEKVKNLSAEEGSRLVLTAVWEEKEAEPVEPEPTEPKPTEPKPTEPEPIEPVKPDKIEYTVTFHTDGGAAIAAQTVESGKKAAEPTVAARTGYRFEGWYTDAACTVKYDFASAVTANMTLYAKWLDVSGLRIYFMDENGDASDKYSASYTGSAIKPDVLVIYNGEKLTGEEYSLTYANNVKAADENAGKAPAVTVKGKGRFTGSYKMTFSIRQVPLETLEYADSMKVVKGQKAVPVISFNGTMLKNSDYTTDPGASVKWNESGDMTVTGKGNFTGSISIKVDVIEKSAQKNIAVSVNTKTKLYYNGTVQVPEVKVTVKGDKSGTLLIPGEDYILFTSGKAVDAGSYSVTVIGIGEYCSYATKKYTINPMKLKNPSATYSGTVYHNAKGATLGDQLEVTGDGEVLREGVDYTVSYSNNKKAGTGKYTVNFKGNYKGTKAVKGSFTIEKMSLKNAEELCVMMADKTGYAKPSVYKVSPAVTLDKTLLKSSDYTVKYYLDEACTIEMTKNNPVKIEGEDTYATVYMQLTGKGSYQGTVSAGSYRVYSKKSGLTDLSKAKVKLEAGSLNFNGEELQPAVTSVKLGKADVDSDNYEVEYLNNVNPGTAKVMIRGKEEKGCCGCKIVTFNVKSSSILNLLNR